MLYNQVMSQLKDPALVSRFRVRMPDQDYEFQAIAESVEAGFKNVPSKTRFAQGKQFHLPDIATLEQFTIVFYETHDWSVTNYLRKWKEKVRKPNGAFGMPVNYQKDIVIELLGMDEDNVIKTMTYKKAWPTDTSPITLNYEDPNGRIQISQAFVAKDLIEA